MIKTIFHFFKIHRKVIFGNPSVIVQDMLRKTPKSFDAVDVILAAIGECFAVVQAVMLAPTFQRIVAPKGIRIVHRSFSGMLPDMGHQFIGCHALYHLRIHPTIALQKPKYNAFSTSASSALAFPFAAKVGFVNLNFSFEFPCLKLSYMINRFTQMLVNACNHLIVKAEVACNAIRRLLLIEAGDNTNLFTQPLERFLFSAGLMSALHIAAPRLAHLKRTAENTLSTPQKVGRTVENIVSSSNHKDILHPRGYETH